MIKSSFTDYFSLIPDHRQQGKVWHPLISVFFIAVAAAVADCDDWEDAVCWAGEKEEWLKKFVSLPHGIPSESTFQRVFRMISPKQFERCFAGWARELAGDMERRSVAVDGKTLRGAKEKAGGTSAVHIVSACLCEQGLTLAEVKTDEKSNETTAIPELLKLLAVENTIVTIDAGGTYPDIARQIVRENHADYVLALKGNQLNMHKDAVLFFTNTDLDKEPDADIKEVFARIPGYITAMDSTGVLPADMPVFLNSDFQSTQTVEKGHGRIERRTFILAAGDISWIHRHKEWEGLKSLGLAISFTTNVNTDVTTIDGRFFISTLDNIGEFASSVRNHWQIESNHWTLDVSFGEDRSRVRRDNEPQNLAMIRKLALNMLKVDKQKDLQDENLSGRRRRESYKVKRKRAMMRDDYLEKVMVGNLK
jgi:predicted transposase YbfD/YdcC